MGNEIRCHKFWAQKEGCFYKIRWITHSFSIPVDLSAKFTFYSAMKTLAPTRYFQNENAKYDHACILTNKKIVEN